MSSITSRSTDYCVRSLTFFSLFLVRFPHRSIQQKLCSTNVY